MQTWVRLLNNTKVKSWTKLELEESKNTKKPSPDSKKHFFTVKNQLLRLKSTTQLTLSTKYQLKFLAYMACDITWMSKDEGFKYAASWPKFMQVTSPYYNRFLKLVGPFYSYYLSRIIR